MSITAQAALAVRPPVGALSPIMFAPGTEVKAKSDMLPFWMTVVSVNERTGFCRCVFGSSDRPAGNFHQSELVFHGGVQVNQVAGYSPSHATYLNSCDA